VSELKSRPPAKTRQPNIDDFISGADEKTKLPETEVAGTVKKEKPQPKPKKTLYSWEEPGVRDDVNKVYNLRLPEAYLLKLKYIADNTPDSMQKFCLQVVQEAIDEKIKQLTGL